MQVFRVEHMSALNYKGFPLGPYRDYDMWDLEHDDMISDDYNHDDCIHQFMDLLS